MIQVVLIWAASAAAAVAPTLTGGGLAVVMDGALPRPRTILHAPSGLDFSAVVAPSSSVTAPGGGGGGGLCTPTLDIGCKCPTCGKDAPHTNSSAACCDLCKADKECNFWVW